MELSDKELLIRLASTEDHFVERKSAGDSRDWLKTVVAFANSAPAGYPAVLFIGVKNDGTIEQGTNLDSLQQKFSKKIADAYPPIPTFSKIVKRDENECLAIIVPGSAERPHFSGPSFVRDGSQTKKAPEKQYAEFIAQRNSMAYEILKWKEKKITVRYLYSGRTTPSSPKERIVTACNQFYLTMGEESHPLTRVEISFDNKNKRLELIISTL
ncbi:MAG: ATP-binding protein [Gammaproteobacteria bacterium]